jgi:spermidine/putrescine transport system substrate-binding protein
MTNPHPHDPALMRGLSQRRLSRRDAFRISGLSATALALAACGVKGKAKPAATTPAPDAVAKFWSGKTGNGHVDFANWPLYMDPKQPELKKFTAKTGITVTYKEVIQDDPSWFAKIQPQLAANQSIGFDLMVVTNGIQFGDLVKLGYLAPLDPKKLVNYTANAADKYKQEAYDPGNIYSVPWASGITGIGYDPDKVTTPPTSMADLWNPKYKGKVGMMGDTQELANFGLLATGANPDQSTAADWQKAADKLKQQRDSGIVRKYYDQSYIDALGKGDVWLTMAWSGDIFQKNVSDGTNLQFVIPSEGATLWTDNMMIPITAANPVDALTLIDYFYDPVVAGSLAEYINYITPVPGAKAAIEADAGKASGDDKSFLESVAKSPLVFPTDTDYARLHYYVQFKTPADQTQFNSLFDPIVTS